MKIRTLSITTTALLLLVGVVILAPVSKANAQAATSANSGQALEIGPPVLNLSGDPGQVVHSTISIRDISDTDLLVTGQINDFVADGEDGTPKILLNENTPDPYSLKAWISPLPTLTLKSKQIQTLPITITIPKTASPGGYYGVVRFSGTPPTLDQTGVSLSASLGALILFKVNGAAKEQMSVEQFFAGTTTTSTTSTAVFESTPVNFVERFKNTGNIQEEPAGVVTITDMFGHTVANLGVNQPPHDVLPGSIRRFTSTLDNTVIGNKFLFGLYHAKLDVTYGANDTKLSSEITFWVIPYRLIAIVIVVLVGGFFLLRFAIVRYNRAIVNRATGRGRRR